MLPAELSHQSTVFLDTEGRTLGSAARKSSRLIPRTSLAATVLTRFPKSVKKRRDKKKTETLSCIHPQGGDGDGVGGCQELNHILLRVYCSTGMLGDGACRSMRRDWHNRMTHLLGSAVATGRSWRKEGERPRCHRQQKPGNQQKLKKNSEKTCFQSRRKPVSQAVLHPQSINPPA